MMKLAKKLWQDESGISAIEYALIAAGIALVIVAGAQLLGNAVNNKLNDVANNVNH